jgi:hypothetical protein
VELHKLHVLYHRTPTNYKPIFIYKVFLKYIFSSDSSLGSSNASPRRGVGGVGCDLPRINPGP